MALPTYVGETPSVAGSGTGSVNVNFSATGRQAGDILFIQYATQNHEDIDSVPLPWKKAPWSGIGATGNDINVLWAPADGTEGNISLSFTGIDHIIAGGSVFRGVDTENPFHRIVGDEFQNSSPWNSSSLTTSVPGDRDWET